MAEEFTLAPMRRLFKKHSDLRISNGAAEELRIVVGDYASNVAEAAIVIALEEDRKTVIDRDVIAARLRVFEEIKRRKTDV
jgi:histone H3/H4